MTGMLELDPLDREWCYHHNQTQTEEEDLISYQWFSWPWDHSCHLDVEEPAQNMMFYLLENNAGAGHG
jgi:hypothetical protein